MATHLPLNVQKKGSGPTIAKVLNYTDTRSRHHA